MNGKEMTQSQLLEILTRCHAATGGPWCSFIEGRDHESGCSFIQTAAEDIELAGASTADQDFMAAARQDIPLLVAEVARLRGWSL